jgi:hypothetical protein
LLTADCSFLVEISTTFPIAFTAVSSANVAKFSQSHEKRLQGHINIEASRLLNVNNITRRLKQKKPFKLVRR